jgi:hypothetical protein
MRNEIMSLFRQAKKTTKLDSSTVSRDKLDDHVFDETVERAQLFKTAVETRPEIGDEGNAQQYVPHWDDLMHDLFVSYHGQDEPSVLPRDQIKQSREANRRVMQQILSTDEHRETRSATKHDPITSAFAAMSVRDKAIDFLQGAGEELAKEAQEAGRQEQKIENADDALEQLREQIAQQEGPRLRNWRRSPRACRTRPTRSSTRRCSTRPRRRARRLLRSCSRSRAWVAARRRR